MTTAAEKRSAILQLLDHGLTMIHVDPRHASVSLPPHLKSERFVNLNFSYRFHIPDLEFGADTLTATLSFQGQPFWCSIPYDCIFGVTSHVSGKFHLWIEEAPIEFLSLAGYPLAARAAGTRMSDRHFDVVREAAGHGRAMPAASASRNLLEIPEEAAPAPQPEPERRRERPAWLRVVK